MLLLAALSGAVLADAQVRAAAPAVSPAEHLLVVPKTAEGVVALAQADARVVARYESFALVEAAGEDDRRLRDAGAQRRDDMREVATAAGEFDPETDRASLAGKRAPDRDEVLALVQFVGPPKDAWVERLRATGRGSSPTRPRTPYVVHASGEAVERVAELVGTDPAVRAVIPLGAADKARGRASGTARATRSRRWPAGRGRAAVGAASRARSSTSSCRRRGRPAGAGPGGGGDRARAAPELTDERASPDRGRQPERLPRRAAPATWPGTTRASRRRSTFAIDVTDRGLDDGTDTPDHPDFYELGSTSEPRPDQLPGQLQPAIRTTATAPATAPTWPRSPRATTRERRGNEDRTATTTGSGWRRWPRSARRRSSGATGIAAELLHPRQAIRHAYSGDARISNNSWGTGTAARDWGRTRRARGSTTSSCATPSRAPAATSRWSRCSRPATTATPIGDENEGYGSISAEGSAKNVITVGASEGVRASGVDGCGTTERRREQRARHRQLLQPRADRRRAPEAGPGGARHARDRRPAPAGRLPSPASAPSRSRRPTRSCPAPRRPRRRWRGRPRWCASGSGRSSGSAPSPAMTKALLINTATDLAGGDNGKGATIAGGPNADQGWGGVNLGSTFDSTTRQLYDQVRHVRRLGRSRGRAHVLGARREQAGQGHAGVDRRSGAVHRQRIRQQPRPRRRCRGATYHGNVFAGAYSRSGGAADFRATTSRASICRPGPPAECP